MALNKTKKIGQLLNRNEQTNTIELRIPTRTILKVAAVLLGVVFLWVIKGVLGIVFIALVLASALDPWVDKLQRFRLPRGLSIFSMYAFIIIVVSVVVYLIVPPFINQVSDIARNLTNVAPQLDVLYQHVTQNDTASVVGDLQRNILNFSSNISNVTSGVFGAVTGVFGSVTTLVIILMLTFYMTVEEDGLKKFIRSIAPIAYQPYLVQKINRIQMKMGSWLRGQLILMLIIGTISYIGLLLLDVPYALVLGVVAGLAEFIPFLGPIIAAIPAIFFAYSDSPWKALGVVILYTIIQQMENQIIVPKVMQKAVGLNPIVVIIAILMGAQVAGLPGILLAVPAATIAWIFIEDIFVQKRAEDNKLEEPTGEVEEEVI